MKIDYVNFLNYAAVHFKANNGRQLNFLDYGQYFNKYHSNVTNILIYEYDDKFTEEMIFFFKNNSISLLRNIDKTFLKLKDISYFNNPTSDILICDFAIFSLLVSNNIPIEQYKKIFIFDCLELTFFFNNQNTSFNTFSQIDQNKVRIFINKYKSILKFLITDYNIPTFIKENIPYIRYYKKINFEIFNKEFIKNKSRIDGLIYYYARQNEETQEFESFIKSIKSKYPDIILTNEFMDIWQYKNILYTPKPYVNYIEQFGRMYFELTYFGYNVIIDNTFKKELKTGLDYYIEYYQDHNIDLNNENFMDIIYEQI